MMSLLSLLLVIALALVFVEYDSGARSNNLIIVSAFGGIITTHRHNSNNNKEHNDKKFFGTTGRSNSRTTTTKTAATPPRHCRCSTKSSTRIESITRPIRSHRSWLSNYKYISSVSSSSSSSCLSASPEGGTSDGESSMASFSIQSEKVTNDNDNDDDTTESEERILNVRSKITSLRLLGKGPNAIVRPGVVLIAPVEEYHHFYRKSAIFIYGMGESEELDNEYVIRGVIIDHPTPFTLREMFSNDDDDNKNKKIDDTNPLGDNLVFRGGDKGSEGVILLHNQGKRYGEGMQEIGTSGLYQGGWDSAIRNCAEDASTNANIANNFKVFFNYCEFTEDQLEMMLQFDGSGKDTGDTGNDNDNDDRWMSVEVNHELILNGEWDRGDCWTTIRNAVKQQYDATTSSSSSLSS